MGLRNYLRSFRGERIGQPDFELATLTSPLRALSQLAAEVLVGGGSQNTTAQPTAFVLRGFEVTDGGTVDIAAGVAMVNFRHRGEVVQGFLVGSASSGKSIPITGYGNGTYKVWIRGALSETDVSNRPAWNPYASPDPTETAKLAATRYTESWDAVIELSTVTPGAEWLEIAEITISGGAIGTITDTRNLFFEGQDANNYAAVDSEWGETATDRDDARSTYGVFGFYRAIRGLQRQVQDIIGAGGWWKAIDRNLLQLLALDGSREMEGNLLPDLDDTHYLGNFLQRWTAVYGRLGAFSTVTALIEVVGQIIESETHFLGGTDYDHSAGSPVNRAVLKFGRLSIYAFDGVDDSGVNGFSLVYNAEWNGSQWDYLYSATRAYRVAIRDTGVSLEERTAATGWADNAWTLLARLGGNIGVSGSDSSFLKDSSIEFYSSGGYPSPTNPDVADAQLNKLYAKNTCKAWGYLETDGAGGFFVEEGFNYSASLQLTHGGTPASANTFRITFAEPLSTAEYNVNVLHHWLGGPLVANVFPVLGAQTATYFDILLIQGNTGAIVEDFNTLTTIQTRISFSVFGVQL